MVRGPLLDHIRKYYNNDIENVGADVELEICAGINGFW